MFYLKFHAIPNYHFRMLFLYKNGEMQWIRCNVDRLSPYFIVCSTTCTLQHIHFATQALCNTCTLQHVHFATSALCNTCTLQYLNFWVWPKIKRTQKKWKWIWILFRPQKWRQPQKWQQHQKWSWSKKRRWPHKVALPLIFLPPPPIKDYLKYLLMTSHLDSPTTTDV